MQARCFSTLIATTAVAAAISVFAAASAQTSGSANGGVWKTSDFPASESDAPSDVQSGSAEQAGRFDAFLEIDGVRGESREKSPPPPPPPENAPSAQQGVQAQGAHQAGLLVPAVQKIRESAARRAADPAMDGVVVLDTALPQGAAVMPEQPACAHCGADILQQQAAPAAASAAAEEQPRRRRGGGFSLSIGGVTFGSGGVSVAAGDVTGDGSSDTIPQGAGRQHAPVRPVRVRDPG